MRDVGHGLSLVVLQTMGIGLKRRNNTATNKWAVLGRSEPLFSWLYAHVRDDRPQIFNRDYRHIVLLSELDALRRAGHGAIVIRQLAQHACRFKASQGHEVDSGFGVAAAGQYAARLRTQREDVTWTVKIGRFRAVGDGRADGGHAVGSGDAGGHTFGPLRWSR